MDSHYAESCYKAFRHVETLFLQGIETLYQADLLLANRVCLPSANQYQACLVQGFYHGQIKFYMSEGLIVSRTADKVFDGQIIQVK